jgi:hypothetical protein
MPSRKPSWSTPSLKLGSLTRATVKPYMEAYLDTCGVVLKPSKGPKYWFYCSNPNCNHENFVQGYSQVWPCGASYRGKPCIGRFYVYKHHAEHVNEPDAMRTPELEAARILALREKAKRKGGRNTRLASLALLTLRL